jgi:hypothetical protein
MMIKRLANRASTALRRKVQKVKLTLRYRSCLRYAEHERMNLEQAKYNMDFYKLEASILKYKLEDL